MLLPYNHNSPLPSEPRVCDKWWVWWGMGLPGGGVLFSTQPLLPPKKRKFPQIFFFFPPLITLWVDVRIAFFLRVFLCFSCFFFPPRPTLTPGVLVLVLSLIFGDLTPVSPPPPPPPPPPFFLFFFGFPPPPPTKKPKGCLGVGQNKLFPPPPPLVFFSTSTDLFFCWLVLFHYPRRSLLLVCCWVVGAVSPSFGEHRVLFFVLSWSWFTPLFFGRFEPMVKCFRL